jgi:hypothetical protein
LTLRCFCIFDSLPIMQLPIHRFLPECFHIVIGLAGQSARNDPTMTKKIMYLNKHITQ